MAIKGSSLTSDFSLIEDAGAKEHPGYASFVEEMTGRCYGSEAINDAWNWFKVGWEGRDALPATGCRNAEEASCDT